jgi:hypothetical protein
LLGFIIHKLAGKPIGLNYYKIKLGNETHYLAIYLDEENKITDMRGY